MEGSRDEKFPMERELFDLEKDPMEMNNIYGDPANIALVGELKAELHRLQPEVGDVRYAEDID